MERYVTYKPPIAVQNHFKKNKQALQVGSPKKINKSPTRQEEQDMSLELNLK